MRAPTVVAIVGEDNAHAVLLGTLLRASIREAAQAANRDWIIDNLEHDPIFHGQEDLRHVCAGLRYTSSLRIDTDDLRSMQIGGKRVKTRGVIGGAPQGVEAHKWRLILMKILGTEPDVVLVARDTDGDPDRLLGLRQAIAFFESLGQPRVIVLAAPHQDAEAWFVAGVEPDGPRELAALTQVSRDLSFDPRLQPARLTAHPNDALTDAKRVLRRLLLFDQKSAPLTPDELARVCERLLGDLARLRQRGRDTGLLTFLDQVTRRVLPLLLPGA